MYKPYSTEPPPQFDHRLRDPYSHESRPSSPNIPPRSPSHPDFDTERRRGRSYSRNSEPCNALVPVPTTGTPYGSQPPSNSGRSHAIPQARARSPSPRPNMVSPTPPNFSQSHHGRGGGRSTPQPPSNVGYSGSNEKENMGGAGVGGMFEGDEHRAKVILSLSRKALNNSGGAESLSRYLSQRLRVLFTDGQKVPVGDDIQSLIISGWVEELLRFLTIKTIVGDVRPPFHMAASKPIDTAWRGLMILPSAYSKVCHALGNEGGVIDHDPFWEEDQSDILSRKNLIESTTRAYQQCFDQDPPNLYWPMIKESSQERFARMISGGRRDGRDHKSLTLLQSFSGFFRNSCNLDDH